MEAKAREIRDAEEYRIFWGNHPTANTKQWSGLSHQLNANTAQIVALTNNYADMTLEKMDEVLDTNIGNPGLLVVSRTGRRKVNALLQAQQRFVDRTEIAGGFRVMTYNEVPIVPSTRRYCNCSHRRFYYSTFLYRHQRYVYERFDRINSNANSSYFVPI
jgi:hypothetical protein